MVIVEVVLRYLQTLLSWPVVVGVLGFALILHFKKPISDWIPKLCIEGRHGDMTVRAGPLEQDSKIPLTKPLDDLKKQIRDGPIEPESEPADELESRIRANPGEAKKVMEEISKMWACERVFNQIFGTQIVLLEHLEEKGEEGEPYEGLFNFYNNHLYLATYTALTQPSMVDYIGFLLNARLVETAHVNNGVIMKITTIGKDFLTYLRGFYPYQYRSKAF